MNLLGLDNAFGTGRYSCRACGAVWAGTLQDHQCPTPTERVDRHIVERAQREHSYEQSPYRAWNMAIDEDAQREVDAIVTDDGA